VGKSITFVFVSVYSVPNIVVISQHIYTTVQETHQVMR